MKKFILFLLLVASILYEASCQNLIMLKGRPYSNDVNSSEFSRELYQARIINGFIYTIEDWDVGNHGIPTLPGKFYAKYDLSGNLIKRSALPVIPGEIQSLQWVLHGSYRNIEMYPTDDYGIVCYIPNIQLSGFNEYAIYKYNADLDSVRLIKQVIPALYTNHQEGYAFDRSFSKTPDGNFLLFYTDSSATPASEIKFKFQKLDNNLNIMWSIDINDHIDSANDISSFYYLTNISNITYFNNTYYFSRIHYSPCFFTNKNDSSCSYFSIYVTAIAQNGSMLHTDTIPINGTLAKDEEFSNSAIVRTMPAQNGYRIYFCKKLGGGQNHFSYSLIYDTLSRQIQYVNPPISILTNDRYSDGEYKKGFVFFNYTTSPNTAIFYNYNSTITSSFLNQRSYKPIPDSFSIYYPNRFQKVRGYRNTWIDENVDTSYLVLGKITLQDSGTYLSIIPLSNAFGNYRGKIIRDVDDNCNYNSSSDKLYKNKTIEITQLNAQAPFKYFTTSDDSGRFNIFTDTGQYAAKVVLPNSLWTACPLTSSFLINSNTDTVEQDFYLQGAYNCPNLTVSVSIGRLRYCFPNTYFIDCCNNGPVSANNAKVVLTVDTGLTVTGASLPFTNVGNVYTFMLGNMIEDSCLQFNLNTMLSCNVPLFSTQCIRAHIYPDSICTIPDARWDKAEVAVDVSCMSDSVVFHIKNIGNGNMTRFKKYIVIEDNVLRIAPTDFRLNVGEQLTITRAANGSTQRINAEQVDYFPYPSNPTAFVEGCNGFHYGYASSFEEDDRADFIDINCTANVAAFDPNDKEGTPSGINAEHAIPPKSDIEYKIRFQNTGNDTAYDVYILDTISNKLDITTLKMGASSHPYTYEIYGEGQAILKVIFPNINLVDSIHNEPLSHGFFSYRISQDTNNVEGDKIFNKAAIYFDYNNPVITNETLHTIGKDWLKAEVITETTNTKFNVKSVKVFPNPFHDKTQIIIESDKLKSAELVLMNIDGKIIKSISTTSNTFDIYREGLNSGMYIFKIMQNKETVATGKLIVQ